MRLLLVYIKTVSGKVKNQHKRLDEAPSLTHRTLYDF